MATINNGYDQLLFWCKKTQNEKQLAELFDLLLTPEEKENLATRCLIIRELLAHEHNQRDIAKNLNVSIAKITRGSNELKRIKTSVVDFIQKWILK